MVSDDSEPKGSAAPSDIKGFANKTASSVQVIRNTSLDFEKQGPGGVKEALGNYQRISVITCMLFMACVMLGLSASCLLITDVSDIRWQKIIDDKARFPNLTRRKSNMTYFENKKLDATPLGKLILCRQKWIKDSVDFGFARHTIVYVIQLGILVSLLVICILHLLLACFFKRVRRCFQLISLGYGFTGLFVLTVCLTTLYFEFVHRVASYLNNALNEPVECKPTPDNQTIDYFIKMCYACAFAFSEPNRFAKGYYGDPYWKSFINDSSFTIENVTYSRDEMMELGICPRQDYLLVSVFLLAITSGFCWFASSYSEIIENEIVGPPVWLQRFKVKIHKGIRHWHTRKKIPTHQVEAKPSIDSFDRDSDEDNPNDDELQTLVRSSLETLSYTYDKGSPVWDDAYDVLDGGFDHILLTDPFNTRGTSTHKLYHSTSHINVTDGYQK